MLWSLFTMTGSIIPRLLVHESENCGFFFVCMEVTPYIKLICTIYIEFCALTVNLCTTTQKLEKSYLNRPVVLHEVRDRKNKDKKTKKQTNK